jgi:hypothetical protein
LRITTIQKQPLKLKDMKTLRLVIAVLLILPFALNVQASDNAKVVGTWEYSAPSAPYPYSEGQIIIKEKDNALTGEVVIDGYSMPCSKVKFENNELNVRFEIEYDYVAVKMKLVNGQLEGKADSPEGYIPLKAKKK